MTLEEFKAIKEHTRVKYIGKDPIVLKQVANESKTAQAKGLVVGYIYDYGAPSKSSWGYGASDKTRGLAINLWSGGSYNNIVPEDWVVMDAKRTDLTRNREKQAVKSTDARVRRELGQFSDYFRKMKAVKGQIDTWLGDIPLASRFKILTSLTEEQKAWLELLDMDPEVVIQQIKKIAEAEPEDTTTVAVATPNASNG
jgi:hypothetical protein